MGLYRVCWNCSRRLVIIFLSFLLLSLCSNSINNPFLMPSVHAFSLIRTVRSCLNRRHRRPHPCSFLSTALATVSREDLPSPTSPLSTTRESLELELCQWNNGQPINWKSPRQVARAVYGDCDRSTRQRELFQATLDTSLLEQQRQMARLVLQLRLLDSETRKQTSQNGKIVVNDTPVPHNSNPTPNVQQTTPRIPFKQQQRQQHQQLSPFEQSIHSMLDNPDCQVDPYWKDVLLQLQVPSARKLVAQLDATQCPMAYNPLATPHSQDNNNVKISTAGNKGTFLHSVRVEKRKHSDCIILTRCGDFYETFGIDALCLVEYCHLASMGGKAKAGCPKQNIQATIDCLVSQGLRVCVYEECSDTDALAVPSPAGKHARIKQRFLSQVVSAASPVYLYNLILQENHSVDALSMGPDARPYVGILESSTGYCYTETNVEERSFKVWERLTADAVACRLAANPPADPLVVVPVHKSSKPRLPFLPSSGPKLRTVFLDPGLVEQTTVSEVDRAKNIFVAQFLKYASVAENEEEQMSVDDFVLTGSRTSFLRTDSSLMDTRTQPLFKETATQLGLMDDKTIPPLVPSLLPHNAPAASNRFLKSWLLTPPPPPVADAMRTLVAFFKGDDSPAFAPFSIPPTGKVLTLIRSGQTSAQVFSEVLRSLSSCETALGILNDAPTAVNKAFQSLLEYESGMAVDLKFLAQRCSETTAIIEQVVADVHHVSTDGMTKTDSADKATSYGKLIPSDFFVRNEAKWRGHVRPDSAPDAYRRVDMAARQLAVAVARDFWKIDLTIESVDDFDFSKLSDDDAPPFVHDKINNFIALKKETGTNMVPPKDRFQKTIPQKFTTKDVEVAISNYRATTDGAKNNIAATLSKLSKKINDEGHVVAVVQAAYTNLILSTAFYHAVQANAAGWSLAETREAEEDCAGKFRSLWPYWMNPEEAVDNTFDLRGMWLFTAPNMSGKSTLMRSTAAAALLSVCGLCAPLELGSVVSRFDYIFVRGASADVPTERKSAFGAEMGDVAALLRSCGEKSLVFVDELGRGTSPRDGASLSGAILEEMARSGMKGVFATHLHDILEFPLNVTGRIYGKRMAIERCNGDVTWSYRVEDGVCKDSMALLTAQEFGLPTVVLDRAKELSQYIPHALLPSGDVASGAKPTLDEQAATMAKNFDVVADALKDVSGQSTAVTVLPGWMVPAHFDGKSVLYVLQLETEPPRFYVGESDAVRNRLNQHRAKKPLHWKKASALLVKAPQGKSQAKLWERQLIRRLSREGFPLESKADGR